MGIFKDVKVSSLVAEAEKATAAGQSLFTPRLNRPNTAHGMSGNIVDWAMMIQGVEEAGWRLEHSSVAMDTKGRTAVYPLFRRL